MRFNIFKLIIVLLIFISGCSSVKELFRKAPQVFGGKPEKVKNKIKHPIIDSVRFSALWIGHSSVLLQIEDKVILIDPVFDDVIGELMLRKVEAGLDIESIPKLDVVLISHAHMDHLSLKSLRDLDTKFPNASLVYPYGVEQYISYYDMDMVSMKTANSADEGYIGEKIDIDGVSITAVFADHIGGRFYVDQYKSLGYTGFIIEYKGITVFYAGDTEYNKDAYKFLGSRYNINLALLPIGPCGGESCESLNFGNHLATFGALLVFDDLNAEYMIPVHYGSSVYGSDTDEPVHVLKDLIDKYKSYNATGRLTPRPYSQRIKILDEGQQYIFEYKSRLEQTDVINK